MFPHIFQDFIELQVTIDRLNDFVSCDELDTGYIKDVKYANYANSKSPDSEKDEIIAPEKYAIVINNGNFYWRNKQADNLYKQGSQKSKKQQCEQIDGKEKVISILDKTDYSDIESQCFLADPDFFHTGFEINNIDLKIKKNSLTFIIGKIGSGKSSLLYSLLGEMSYQYPNNSSKSKSIPSVYIENSISYLSQKPFIIGATIKENITLDLPYNYDLLAWAIKYSALEDEICLMENGLNTEITESGNNLSGGQRVRLA